MRIKLLSDYEGALAGSICDCDEAQGSELVGKGMATADSTTPEEAMVTAKILAGKKISKKDTTMENEFAIGKMFRAIAQKSITGNSETGSAADGGNIVFTGLGEIAPLVILGSKVYAKCRKIPVSAGANAMKVPFSTSDYWTKATAPVVSGAVAEGVAGTPTKIQFGYRTLTLGKAVVPVAITEELLEDNAATDAYVRTEIVGKLANVLDYEILKGGGSGLAAVIGDTGYAVTSTVSGTTTLLELQTLVSKVHPGMNPEFYMSITAWNKMVSTFGTQANIMLQLIDIKGKELLGYTVNVMPFLAATDIVFGDFSQYTVIESPLGQRLQVSLEARFLEGEVCYKLSARQAGAATFAARATGDSLTVAAFSTNA